jgi:hypothetical protein
LVNAETLQVVTPVPVYQAAGAEVRFTDGTGIGVDESVEDIEALR